MLGCGGVGGGRGHTKRRKKEQQRRDDDVGRVLLIEGAEGAEDEAEGFLDPGEEDGEGEPLPVLELVVCCDMGWGRIGEGEEPFGSGPSGRREQRW